MSNSINRRLSKKKACKRKAKPHGRVSDSIEFEFWIKPKYLSNVQTAALLLLNALRDCVLNPKFETTGADEVIAIIDSFSEATRRLLKK